MQNDAAQAAEQDSTYHMTREHAAAFKRVLEKRRIVWCDYAAAFQAALECVNTKQSQEFISKYIFKGIPNFCGEGDPSITYGPGAAVPGSAWDDWCGKGRRKLNERTEDQTVYFKQALRCAIHLVLAALDRGAAELIDAADPILDPASPIFCFCRESNRAAFEEARELHRECVAIWREGGGPAKRLALLEKAPWRCLVSVVKSALAERGADGVDVTEVLHRVASRIEDASGKDLSESGNCCIDLIQLIRNENRQSKISARIYSPADRMISQSDRMRADRKAFKKRLMMALREVALKGTKSSVWAQRRDSLRFLEFVIKADKEYKECLEGKCLCSWLDEQHVIEDLFGERAHATIVSETVPLLSLIELNEVQKLITVFPAAEIFSLMSNQRSHDVP